MTVGSPFCTVVVMAWFTAALMITRAGNSKLSKLRAIGGGFLQFLSETWKVMLQTAN